MKAETIGRAAVGLALVVGVVLYYRTLELGLIYAMLALGVFLSYRTLNMPDMTVDGSFTMGAAVSATLCAAGYPLLGILLGVLAGAAAGCVTALLHTRLKIQPLLSGILMMLALYSINLHVMNNKANIPLLNVNTIFSYLEPIVPQPAVKLTLLVLILALGLVMLFLFLKTKLGLALRATGDNAHMVRALGVNTDTTILLGLAASNGLVAFSGGLIAQYQSFADVGMGVGMVAIGLASVIIGEVIFGTKSLVQRLLAVALGAVLYRYIIAFALNLGMPATDLKLVSAAIVAIALSAPVIREGFGRMGRRFRTSDGNRRSA